MTGKKLSAERNRVEELSFEVEPKGLELLTQECIIESCIVRYECPPFGKFDDPFCNLVKPGCIFDHFIRYPGKARYEIGYVPFRIDECHEFTGNLITIMLVNGYFCYLFKSCRSPGRFDIDNGVH